MEERMYTIRSFLLTILTGISGVAFANTPPQCTTPTAPAGTQQLVIDARTGGIEPAKVHFGRHDHVQVIIKNKNPFRFKYTLTAKAVTVEETALSTFIGFISTFNLEEAKKDNAAKVEKTEKKPGETGSGADLCETEKLEEIRQANTELGSNRQDLGQKLSEWAATQKTAADANNAAQTVFADGNAECAKLVGAATTLITELQKEKAKVPDADMLTKRIQRLRLLAEIQVERIAAYRLKAPNCADRVKDAFERAQDIAGPVADAWSASIDKLKAGQKKLDDVRTAVETILAQGTSFVETTSIGDYDLPTNVTLTLKRTDLDGKSETTLLDQNINFGGGPLFSIGVGPAGSPMARTQYQRVQGFAINSNGTPVLDSNNQPVFTNIVGAEEISRSRITPMLALHGRLLDSIAGRPVSLQLTLGVTAKNDNKGTNVEYLVGPSLGLIDDRVFFTTGLYGGRKQVLDGGFYVGEQLPEKLTDIPIRKDLHWGIGFALTLKAK
jgi:hypothetical protein